MTCPLCSVDHAGPCYPEFRGGDRTIALLRGIAAVFRKYARMHEAKGTASGMAKADANRMLAETVEEHIRELEHG